MQRNIYFFQEAEAPDPFVLGGKGANLAIMTQIGLPIPKGFTITTQSCMDYIKDPNFFEQVLSNQVLKAVAALEELTQKNFKQSTDENLLLVSVRSGAPFSMPGMMDTILNLGLNDARVLLLAKKTNLAFAFDCYRRLLQMFADVVYHIPKENFNLLLKKAEDDFQQTSQQFSLQQHQVVIEQFKAIYQKQGLQFPQDPVDQLFAAIKAVFQSWNNQRAKVYRQLHKISDTLGSAVNVQEMVFGNSGLTSATGVVFTRNPATGEKGLFGEYLLNAQGEDVVAGIRTPENIHHLQAQLPKAYQELLHYTQLLEKHYRDMQDIEFTIEEGKLYLLQTRNGKRTAKAQIQICYDLVQEQMIDKKEALRRIKVDDLEQLLHPTFEATALNKTQAFAKGLPASPGAASGIITFTAKEAQQLASLGHKVILLREETSPEDIEGMIASQAIVTSHGGMTSHAAVVARGMGMCCVTGCEALHIDEQTKNVQCGDLILKQGDMISVDGTTGLIYQGELPCTMVNHDQILSQILLWADEIATVKVRANAETPQDIQNALDFNATGIGLARTEHMFFNKNRILTMRKLILADNFDERNKALAKLQHYQEADFKQMYQLVQDKPMIIRLLDPPLHEFLPNTAHELEELAQDLAVDVAYLKQKIAKLQEKNPMLGHRGCRLAISHPEIYQMQVRAIFNSVITLRKSGINIVPEIMIPLIAEANELSYIRQQIEATIHKIFAENHIQPFEYQIGTMLELPRACLKADTLTPYADFFSFGTNDLTQMTYGFSRDDIAKFIHFYHEKAILTFDPFQKLDCEGVGKLMQIAIQHIKSIAKQKTIGVCGEVGGDCDSIFFLQQIGVDYVSCSPYRIPCARLAAAKARLN